MISSTSIISTISTIRNRANQIIQDDLRQHGINDVVPAQGGIFVALFKNTEMTMGDIAQAIGRDKSTVTSLIKKLNRLNYLEKRKDDADGRITRIHLTEKGRALEPIFIDISKHLIENVYSGFTDLEKDVLIALLERIKMNL